MQFVRTNELRGSDVQQQAVWSALVSTTCHGIKAIGVDCGAVETPPPGNNSR